MESLRSCIDVSSMDGTNLSALANNKGRVLFGGFVCEHVKHNKKTR